MAITVKRRTVTELEANRRELVESVAMSEEQLREHARNAALRRDERQVLREIDNIDYLLGR